MFCAKCGKQFQGEGYLCPQCAQENAGYVVPAACYSNPAPAAPVAPAAPAAPVDQQPSLDYTAPAGGYTPPVYQQPAYQQPAYQQPAYQQPAYQQPAYQQPAYQAAPAAQEASGQPVPGFTLSSPDDGKKPGKKKKGLAIGLGILALVLIVGIVVVALNWNNWFGGSKSGNNGDKPVIVNPEDIPEDPDDYIAFLHEAQAEGLSKNIAEAFGALGADYQAGSSVDAKLKLTMGKQLLGLLEDAVAESGMKMDLDWLKEISLDISTNIDSKRNESMNMALAIGKQKILSIDAVMDFENMTMYMAIPELNKKYIKMDMGNVTMLGTDELMAQLMQDMPSEQEMEKLLNGYMDIFAKYLDGAQRQEVTLTVGKGSEDVTALTVTVTEEELAQLIQEILEYTKENETSRKIAQAFINYSETVAANDPYGDVKSMTMADFEDFLDEGIDAMDEIIAQAEEGNYIEITTYANLAEIRGYNVQVYADGEPINQLNFYAVHDGGKIYVDMQINAEDSYAGASGVLTQKSGKLNGELAVQIDGEELATIELKNVNSDGYGTYVIAPNPALLDELGMDEMVSSLISGLSIELKVSEGGLEVSIVNSKGTLISLGLSASTGKAGKVTIPSNAIDGNDYDAMEQWTQDMDLGKLLDNLKKAGLPNDLYKMLKQMLG